MKGISPEIENLMWTLAETGNVQAIDEFEARYPELKIELAKRLSMVRSLKVSRPEPVRRTEIPRFMPDAASSHSNRAPYVVATGLTAVALCAIVFAATSSLRHNPPELPIPQHVKLDTIQGSTPPVALNQTSPGILPPQSGPRHINGTDEGSVQTSARNDPPQNEPPKIEPKWAKPQIVRMRQVPLITALRLVAAQGGLTLQIAPLMPNPSIQVDYQGRNAVDILKDLGRTYGFTPLLNDDGSVLIIPAVDRSAPAVEPTETIQH